MKPKGAIPRYSEIIQPCNIRRGESRAGQEDHPDQKSKPQGMGTGLGGMMDGGTIFIDSCQVT